MESIPASAPSLSALKKLWASYQKQSQDVKIKPALSVADEAIVKSYLKYSFIIRPSPKRLSLRFDSAKRQFVLNWPPRLGLASVIDFLGKNQVWIETIVQKNPEIYSLGHGGHFTLLGRLTQIEINQGRPSLNHVIASLDNHEAFDRLIYHGDEANLGYRLERHIRKLTLLHAKSQIEAYAHALMHNIERVSLFSARSRWGSCSPKKKTIRIHWRLGLSPIEVLDYVCAHEAAHLKHPDHSHEFWACVGSLMPDYANPKAWLKTNGSALHAYQFRPLPPQDEH
jgi:predicted metal-dependent hydrolase